MQRFGSGTFFGLALVFRLQRGEEALRNFHQRNEGVPLRGPRDEPVRPRREKDQHQSPYARIQQRQTNAQRIKLVFSPPRVVLMPVSLHSASSFRAIRCPLWDCVLRRRSRRRAAHLCTAEQVSCAAARWIESCQRDLSDHIIAVNERHLNRLITAYVGYCHEDCTHLGLGNATRQDSTHSSGPRDFSRPRV